MNDGYNKQRTMCPICRSRVVAINRYLKEKVYYRKTCDSCSRAKAAGRVLKPQPPLWARSGYKKKDRCEMCNFKATTLTQMFVYHVDGDLKNINSFNLKTVCANCQIEISGTQAPWRPATIVPDF